MTTIRLAEPRDLPRIVEMGTLFVAESPYWRLGTASLDRIEALARFLGSHQDGCVFVADVDGQVVGMLAGHLPVHPMLDIAMASELAWWVDPPYRVGKIGLQLLAAFEQWAKDHGATHLLMVAPDEKVATFYERRKFARVEMAYARRL